MGDMTDMFLDQYGMDDDMWPDDDMRSDEPREFTADEKREYAEKKAWENLKAFGPVDLDTTRPRPAYFRCPKGHEVPFWIDLSEKKLTCDWCGESVSLPTIVEDSDELVIISVIRHKKESAM